MQEYECRGEQGIWSKTGLAQGAVKVANVGAAKSHCVRYKGCHVHDVSGLTVEIVIPPSDPFITGISTI